jgi:hypothetical protein
MPFAMGWASPVSRPITSRPISGDRLCLRTADITQPLTVATRKRWGDLIDRLSEREGVMVLDGGGNRPHVDEILSAAADLVLVPFQTSADDMRVAAADLDRLPTAVGIPTRLPNNRWERDVAERVRGKYLGSYRSRIAAPVFAVAAFATLVEDGPPSPRINGTCKQIALSVLQQLGLTLFDLRAA